MLYPSGIRLYRIGRYFYLRKLRLLARPFELLNKLLHNSHVPSSCEIGEDSQFGYGGISLVIHSKARVGRHCSLGSCVTIGGNMGAGAPPVIEDNVYIATGAKVLGNVTVGHDSIVGANAVVIRDVEPYSVVGGVPAKLICRITKETFEMKYKHCYGPLNYME